jgi:hypothetical protein
VRNDTDERIHYDQTILKKRVDGTECGSSFLDPGEETIDALTSRATQQQPDPPEGQ